MILYSVFRGIASILFLNSSVETRRIGPSEFFEPSVLDRLSDPGHEMIVEIEVVHHAQAHGKHLFGLEQMAQIAAGIAAAHRAVAFRVDGVFVPLVFGVFQIDRPLPGEELGVAARRWSSSAFETARRCRRFP